MSRQSDSNPWRRGGRSAREGASFSFSDRETAASSNTWRRGGLSSRESSVFSGREEASVSWLRDPASSPSPSIRVPCPWQTLDSSVPAMGGDLRIVKLSEKLQKCYQEAKAERSSLDDWGQKYVTDGYVDIEKRVEAGKRGGFFAATALVYSVFLLGSLRISSLDPNVEKTVQTLYRNGFTKVQHGIFADINRALETSGDESDRSKVAEELATLFNKNEKKNLRSRTRMQWMEFNKNEGLPHHNGKYLSQCIEEECEFFIGEYIKHGPSLGLSVEEYLELTSILYEHCNPNFGNINQTGNYAFLTEKCASSKPTLNNTFTQQTLSNRLLSVPGPDQQIPFKAIFNCNNTHDLSILTEIRYKFSWRNDKLVGHEPVVVDCRVDNCRSEGSDHSYSYLTQRDRATLKNAITKNPLYGFYEIARPQQSHHVAKTKPPGVAKKDVAKKTPEDGEWTKVVGKGKKK
ncbi:hypothetical protein OROMI_025152 [Orobanche minor]